MVKVNSSGVIRVPMMVTFIRTTSMVLVSTSGLTAEFTRVIGLTIEWKVGVFSPGVTVVSTWASTETIRNTALARLHGRTGGATRVNGTKENNMGRVFTLRKVRNVTEYGKWAKELNGLKMIKLLNNDSYRLLQVTFINTTHRMVVQ